MRALRDSWKRPGLLLSGIGLWFFTSIALAQSQPPTQPMYGYHNAGMMGYGGHWFMSLIGILVIVVLILSAAALLKYLFKK